MNIILVGMPGAGKSTVGVLLAKALGMQFADTDLMVQAAGGGRLPQIIAREGTQGFLDLESGVILALQCDNTVIATGGSVVLRPASMAHLRKMGCCVYLRADCGLLKERAGEMGGRGVVFEDGQTFEDVYATRRPLYEACAHIAVDAGQSQAQVVRQIEQRLPAISSSNGS